MNEGDDGARAIARAANELHRPPPRPGLEAFDALARHDALAADPLDGAGIQLALEWEWELAEHGIPEGIAREALVALTGGTAPIEPPGGGGNKPSEEVRGRANGEEEEAA